MSRRPVRFTKREISNAIDAVARAGVQGRVEVYSCGKLVVIVGEPSKTENNPLDQWMAKHAGAAEGN
jgi:hypothetical protein